MHHAHSTYQLIYCSATVTGKNKQTKQSTANSVVYNNNFVLNDNPHLFSKLFLVTGVQVVWGTLHHLFYLELRQEGPKLCGIWSSWPYYKVPRQLTKNTGGLLRPTFGTHILPPMAKAFVIWAKQKSMEIILEIWKCIPPTVGEAM